MNETTKILLLFSAYALLVVIALVIKISSKIKTKQMNRIIRNNNAKNNEKMVRYKRNVLNRNSMDDSYINGWRPVMENKDFKNHF
ncbi:hypothetical protein [Aurantibacillus circumpalustris]|uniref:hypothetical protein n=1 Tax=Aurantibacillus circumpalustris TaxID=3036359 RepID=UPI00295ADBD5|nr:hypothetical protein [Aurantibacillus circumpalustris]